MTLLAIGAAKIEVVSVALALGVLVDDGGTDATLRLQIQGGRLTVTLEDLPFMQAALPEGGLVVDADIDLSWSHRHGVRLDGRAELTTQQGDRPPDRTGHHRHPRGRVGDRRWWRDVRGDGQRHGRNRSGSPGRRADRRSDPPSPPAAAPWAPPT